MAANLDKSLDDIMSENKKVRVPIALDRAGLWADICRVFSLQSGRGGRGGRRGKRVLARCDVCAWSHVVR
jgi:hypothetical protein